MPAFDAGAFDDAFDIGALTPGSGGGGAGALPGVPVRQLVWHARPVWRAVLAMGAEICGLAYDEEEDDARSS